MDFIRCPDCHMPLSRRSKACPHCGEPLQPSGGLSLADVVEVFKTTFHKMIDFGPKESPGWKGETPKEPAMPEQRESVTEQDIERLLEKREKQKEPMKCAAWGLLFALIGLFVLAIVFVPLAILFTGAGFIGSILRFRLDAFVVSLLGFYLIYWAVLTSPSLWILIGLSAQ